MIFACCELDIEAESRIPFVLKILCGLSIEAISRALLQPVEVIKKRLYRTRKKLQEQISTLPNISQLQNSLDKVHTVLYLVFNEGFHSTDNLQPINLVLCQEAIGLTKLLIDDPSLPNRDTYGLLALMHFHWPRAKSKVDHQGLNIPIDLQDRSCWDQSLFKEAKLYLYQAHQNNKQAVGQFFY